MILSAVLDRFSNQDLVVCARTAQGVDQRKCWFTFGEIVTATRELEHDIVMTTNLGFGGAAAALVLRPTRRP